MNDEPVPTNKMAEMFIVVGGCQLGTIYIIHG